MDAGGDKLMDVAGALLGWKRAMTDDGVVLRLQVAENKERYKKKDFEAVTLFLNDRQLRSYTRDLIRASKERSIKSKPDSRLLSIFKF